MNKVIPPKPGTLFKVVDGVSGFYPDSNIRIDIPEDAIVTYLGIGNLNDYHRFLYNNKILEIDLHYLLRYSDRI